MGVTPRTYSMLHLFLLISLTVRVRCRYEEPREAFGVLKENITNPGEIDQLGDPTVVRLGPPTNDKWIIWAHDIYGVDSGRTKEYCEKMNQDLGVTCVLPDFFRGVDGRPDPVPSWDQLVVDWEGKLVPYLHAAGAQSVAVVGTCFGSYLGVHMSASNAATFMKGGIYYHPAHPGLMEKTGEDEADVYRQISSPQAFMDTPDSAASVREGGL